MKESSVHIRGIVGAFVSGLVSWRTAMAFAASAMLVTPLGRGALAGEPAGKECAGCPVEKKVSELLVSWKEASEEARALTQSERQRISAHLASLAKRCPVGSRLGETLVAVRDVLGGAVAADEALSKHCPAKTSPGETGIAADVLEAGRRLGVARSKALRGLHELASHVVAATSGSCWASNDETRPGVDVECGPEKRTSSTSKTATTGACPVTCAATSPVRMAARIGALRASWNAVPSELAAQSDETRREIAGGIGSIAETSKMIALVPPSVVALVDGFEALEAIHGEMAAWAIANPAAMRSMPVEVRIAFESHRALIGETRELLLRAKAAMEAARASCDEESAPIETAVKR